MGSGSARAHNQEKKEAPSMMLATDGSAATGTIAGTVAGLAYHDSLRPPVLTCCSPANRAIEARSAGYVFWVARCYSGPGRNRSLGKTVARRGCTGRPQLQSSPTLVSQNPSPSLRFELPAMLSDMDKHVTVFRASVPTGQIWPSGNPQRYRRHSEK